MKTLSDRQGMALILTLLVLALITAMVAEFAYGVYTGTNSLHNWYDSQRLSVLAGSGMDMAVEFISEKSSMDSYTYPGSFEKIIENPSAGFDAKIIIRMEDENSKFNINTIVQPVGGLNAKEYNSFKRLLSNLSIDENVADYVADWIDRDSEERRRDSEQGAKNTWLYSVDEMLFIKGIDRPVYDKLLPYVTVYGKYDMNEININSAEKPVLMSLSDDMTEDLARRVMDFRKNSPFENISQLQKVAGFTSAVYNPISARITVKAKYFRVKASASSGGIQRIIEAVAGTGKEIKYWREF